MEDQFKKDVLRQLNKTMNELEKLLKIEGSLSDISELSDLAEQSRQTLHYLRIYKKNLENDRLRPRRIRPPRITYAQPLKSEEDFDG